MLENGEQVELAEGAYVNASLDALSAAAGFVARTWGEYGYRVERVAAGSVWGGVRLGIACSDGSRFTVESDRYGNVREVLA
jgi:hypothetical protein